jgi:hypothetical protein
MRLQVGRVWTIQSDAALGPSSHTAHTPGHLFSVSKNSLRRAADGSRRHFREPCALSKQTRACRCASACAECCSDESAFNCIFFSRRHSACCAAVRPGHDGRLSISVTRPMAPSALTALSGVARCRLGFDAESHSKRECFSVGSNRTQAQHGTKCGAQVLNLNSFTDVELRDRRYVFCGVRLDGSEAQARSSSSDSAMPCPVRYTAAIHLVTAAIGAAVRPSLSNRGMRSCYGRAGRRDKKGSGEPGSIGVMNEHGGALIGRSRGED